MSPPNADVELAPNPERDATGKGKSHDDRSALMKCINKIPLCGGFCAPTNSTEKSCLRHFSNQETPPQPCLARFCCRKFWEHNMICRSFGRLGTKWGDSNRSTIMFTAFCMSFISWIFCFVALAATSSETSVIKNVAWAKGTTVFDSNSYPPSGASMDSWIGLNYRVDETTPAGGTMTSKTVNWDDDDACVLHGLSYSGCSQCSSTATDAVSWMVVTVITQIFQITTDLQRTTRYGDLNCQKMMGTCTSLFGAFSTFQSLKLFMTDCANKDGLDWFGESTEPTYTTAGVPSTSYATFQAGPGFALLFTAILLKLFDAACHLIVPTPVQKNEYVAIDGCEGPSLEEYLDECKEECHWGKPVASGLATADINATNAMQA